LGLGALGLRFVAGFDRDWLAGVRLLSIAVTYR